MLKISTLIEKCFNWKRICFHKIEFSGSARIEPYCELVGIKVSLVIILCNAFCQFLGDITIGENGSRPKPSLGKRSWYFFGKPMNKRTY